MKSYPNPISAYWRFVFTLFIFTVPFWEKTRLYEIFFYRLEFGNTGLLE